MEFSAAESSIERIEVPVTPAAEELTRRRPARTVLCIEDNVASIRLIERVLEVRPNVHVLAATQGSLGLDLAKMHRPDLILLDLNLPDMHGRDVLWRLRQTPDTAEIPVVVLSADATPGQIQRLMEAGAYDYLTKPINVRTCLEVLDEVLGHKA